MPTPAPRVEAPPEARPCARCGAPAAAPCRLRVPPPEDPRDWCTRGDPPGTIY